MSALVTLRQAAAPLAAWCSVLPGLIKSSRGYVTKEAASDSDPIPKPRKGSPNDVADRPPPPTATPVIEPGMNPAEWDPKDPRFQKLTKQLVFAIESRPAPEVTGQVDVAEPSRHMPSDRHTDARSGNVYESDVQVNAGRINVLHLKEIYTKRWEARSKGKSLRVEELAKEYGLNPRLLEKVFRHTELPIIRQDRRGRTVGYSADEAFELLKEEQETLA